MASLTTVYIVSLILGSLSAVGSAFVGTKIYPIQTGIDPLQGPQQLKEAITEKVADVMKPTPEPLEVETVKEEPAAEQPMEEPAAEEPAVEQPAVEQPAVVEQDSSIKVDIGDPSKYIKYNPEVRIDGRRYI